MDYQNLNTLISSRDFAWAFPPPPQDPGPSASPEVREKFNKALEAYYERYGKFFNPDPKKSVFDRAKETASKVYTGIGNQFTDRNSFLQRTADRGYGQDEDFEGGTKLQEARKNGDPLIRVLRTATGVAKAGRNSFEDLQTELAGDPVGRHYQKTVDQLAERGVKVGNGDYKDNYKDIVSGKVRLKISSSTPQDKRITEAKDKVKQLQIEHDNQLNKVIELRNERRPEADKETSVLKKSKAQVAEAEARVKELETERENFIRNADVVKASAQEDLAKAAKKDKEERNQRAFEKGAKIAQGTKDVAGSALSLVSSTHAAKEARRMGAGGVQARNARVAYLLGDRSLGTKVMSGHLFKGDNAVSRFINKKVTRGAVRKINNRGFSDEIDLLKLREAQAISYMLTKDYTQFEDFSEIARPTVVKTSNIGKEELENGKVLSDEVEIPYVREQSGLKDPVDLLEKNYYQASPEEKKFQESLFIGFSEESDGGNYEKTLESLSKIVNPYE